MRDLTKKPQSIYVQIKKGGKLRKGERASKNLSAYADFDVVLKRVKRALKEIESDNPDIIRKRKKEKKEKDAQSGKESLSAPHSGSE